MKTYLFVIGIFLFKDAYAYLDPGSGNALVCLFLSLIGAFFYYLKSFFYKIVCKLKGKESVKQQNEQVALFSEGKNYWYTYKPIISELIGNKIPFIYYTMDVEDPALLIDNEYMHSKYIGSGNRGFAKVGALKTKLLITTTPNIGCQNYPIKRPYKVEKLCHIWHSLCDSSCYHMGALDHYDVAFTVGEWVEESLRKVEQIRNIKKKDIVPIGLPYFDELKRIYDYKKKDMPISNKAPKNEKNVILLAPSWGDKNCIKVYGTEFIHDAINNGFNIIIRPHPQSLKVEMDFINKLQNEFIDSKSVYFDFNPDATDSMMKSDMMISDKSGVRFDYSLIYEKPVLTLDFSTNILDEYEAKLLGRLWGEEESEIIGIRLLKYNKNSILKSIENLKKIGCDEITKLRTSVLCNYGSSAQHLVEWIKNEIN